MRKSPLDTRPERRPLRIFAYDPMLARGGEHRMTVHVPYRPMERGERFFRDDRLEVIDYDAATQKYFRAVDLDDNEIAMTEGLEPLEHDPQFHQQMVYAVASKVLENFDRALGRRLRFRRGERLRLIPHAFQGRNAYFDEDLNAVLFGYFQADEEDPGANLPQQLVFTCLSHDIIAHEVAHAALTRLKPYFREATNRQVPALHEAFADIVALMQRLTFPEIVAREIRETHGNLLDPNSRLLDLGAQFGSAAGMGSALRRINPIPDPGRFASTKEPHALGWILVSAVYQGFVRTYEARVRDLIRIATGGSGELPKGEMHPDLVNRLTSECVRTAQAVLSMCIRATDYLPPIDPTFSDFLRAMVTADFELNRSDDLGLRAAMIEAFRQHGIRPQAVGSLAVPSLLLQGEDASTQSGDTELAGIVAKLQDFGVRELSRNVGPLPSRERARKRPRKVKTFKEWLKQQSVEASGEEESQPGILPPTSEPEPDTATAYQDEPEVVLREVAIALHAWAEKNRDRLSLDPQSTIAVTGFHPVHRTAQTGELLVEMVVHFQQRRPGTDEDLGGLVFRAGVTMIANIEGRIRYLICKPFDTAREEGLREWVREFDAEDGAGWSSRPRDPDRIVAAFSARAMDRRRWR